MAMLYAVFGVFAAATMVSVTLTMSMSTNRQAQTHVRSSRVKYLADGAVEQAKQELAESIANWRTPDPTGVAVIDGIAVPYTVTPTGFDQVSTDAAGIQTLVTGYEIDARATQQGFTHASRRLVNSHATPIFQFAVFYTGDLEINPGPNMTLGGRVHTNSDMFLNCGGTLTMNTNYVRAVGDIYRRRKNDTSVSEGRVKVRQWVVNPFDPSEPVSYFDMHGRAGMSALGITTASGFDSDFTAGYDADSNGDFLGADDWYNWTAGAPIYWSQPDGYTAGVGHTMLSGAHGIGQAAVPHIGSIQMFEPASGGAFYLDPATGLYEHAALGSGTHDKGYYHENAGLSIITHDDGTIVVHDATGADVTAAVSGALSTDTTYDARQAEGGGGDVFVTQIDLGALAATGLWPSNGLVYASHYGSGGGTRAKGVRLVNGSTLAGPLTVVSENSVYVQGDYNTVAKKGAAVIADAVNLLSNAWNDSKTPSSGLPNATATTYNLAIISGNTNTVENGKYNGGLENLPRFHENWTGVNCRITGSFVNTWNSQYADADWAIGGKYYKAPNRIWNYDSRFNNVANLPPFTPMAVATEDVCSW